MPMNPPEMETILDLSQLPTLPQTLVELIAACNDSETNLAKVAEIVTRDATISARVLQLANSAFLGTRSSFSDTGQAVIFLGTDTVRNIAVSVSVHEVFQSYRTPSGLSLARYWHHSLLTAVIAVTLARRIEYPQPAEAYLAGLLHDLGKLLLCRAFPGEYGELLSRAPVHPSEFAFLERARLGISHADAGSLLVQRWNLQSPIAEALRMHDDVETLALPPLAAILMLANTLAGNRDDEVARHLAIRLGIVPDALGGIVQTANETVTAIAAGMGIVVEAPPDADGNEPAADRGRLELISRVDTLTRLNGMLDNLVRADSTDRILTVIETSMQILFGLQRALVFVPEDDGRKYHALGSTLNPLAVAPTVLTREDRPMEELIDCCRSDPSPIIIGGEHGPSGPAFLHRLLDSRHLLVLPLTCRRWQGLLVAAIDSGAIEALAGRKESLLFFARHAASSLHNDYLFRSQAEQMARQRVDAAQKVARRIAHEINTPLAVVENYLTVLGANLSDRRDLQQKLQTIGEEIARIGTISRQLNDLSAPATTRNGQLLDLNRLVQDTLSLFEHSLFSRQAITVSFSGDPNIPQIASSAGALRQILTNLLQNAAEAMPQGGRVIVGTSLRQPQTPLTAGMIEVDIEDNGPGIPAALVDSIFSAGVTSKGDGHLGLGLAIVRKLAAELDGAVSCQPGQNGGTCFTLRLWIRPE